MPPLEDEEPDGDSVPQAEPEHPAPERSQVRAGLGLDPGTGISVAVICAEPPVRRFAGPERVSVKVLVKWTMALDCLEGSAALVATMEISDGLGRFCGAV